MIVYEYGSTMCTESLRRLHEDHLSRYDGFSRRELPSRVRRKLELHISEDSSVLEETLKSMLLETIRECQEELFREYMRANDLNHAVVDSSDQTMEQSPAAYEAPGVLDDSTFQMRAIDPTLQDDFWLRSNQFQLSDSGYGTEPWGVSMPFPMDALLDDPLKYQGARGELDEQQEGAKDT